MDPLFTNIPKSFGQFSPCEGVSLYFERRGDPAAPEKVVMLMGALATLRHFDQFADGISKSHGGSQFEVLTFDHRGIGKSSISAALRLQTQTSSILATDALALIRHLWISDNSRTNLHVYGASMGGMVAQILATKVIGDDSTSAFSLKSLTLAVTARSYGYARFIPLGPRFYRTVLPWVIPSEPAAMIDSLLPKCFSVDFLRTVHPTAGETYSALWKKRWVEEYKEWYAFHDLDAMAAQSTVAGLHYLSDADARIICDTKVAILVCIAEGDTIMAPSAQHSLARLLDASTHVTKGGHLGNVAEYDAFVDAVVQHMYARIATATTATPTPATAVSTSDASSQPEAADYQEQEQKIKRAEEKHVELS